MADTKLLAKLVTTTGEVSSGAIITLEGKTETTSRGLEIVPDLVRLVAHTVASASSPPPQDVERVQAFLSRLIRRYGTMARALAALATRRREHGLVSAEKAADWSHLFAVPAGRVESELLRHGKLHQALERWANARDSDTSAALLAYAAWLDGPLTGFRDPGHSAQGQSTEGQSAGDASSGGHAEPAGGSTRLTGEAERLVLQPSADADHDQVFAIEDTSLAEPPVTDADDSGYIPMDAIPGARVGWSHVAERSTDGPAHVPLEASDEPRRRRRHEDDDVELIWTTVFDDKRPMELPGDRGLSAAQQEAIARLRGSSDAFRRAVAAVATHDFGLADSFLAHLDEQVDEEALAMLRGHRYELEGRHDEALTQYLEAAPPPDDAPSRRALAVAMLRARRGSKKAHFADAIRTLRATLDALTDDSVERARTLALLGFALMRAPVGDRRENLAESIKRFDEALKTLTAEQHGPWWAETNHYLGVALLEGAGRRRPEVVERAIERLDAALHIWTREHDPGHWAAVQQSLGSAYERCAEPDREACLSKAIEHYTNALEVRTRERFPVGWAKLQQHLGDVWLQRRQGDMREHAQKSIACHTAAAEVWAREHRKLDWAATQNSLGNAWALMPAADRSARDEQLRRAIRCYQAALEVRTPENAPAEWASTQNNLGTALLQSAQEGESAPVRDAILCFKAALQVRTRERNAIEWARTRANLGQAFAWLARVEPDRFGARARTCLNDALSVFTQDRFPHEHRALSQRLAEVSRSMNDSPVPGVLDD